MMEVLFNISAYFSLTNFIFATTVFYLTFLTKTKLISYRLFNFAIAAYSPFFAFSMISHDPYFVTLGGRFTLAFVVFITYAYARFCVNLVKIKLPELFWKINFLITLGFSITSIFTDKIVLDSSNWIGSHPWLNAGDYFNFYVGFYSINALLGIFALLYKQKENPVFKDMLIATVFGFFGGTTNFIALYGYPLPPILNGLVTFYCLLMAKAILKTDFFKLKVSVSKFSSLSISFVLLLIIFIFINIFLELDVLTFTILFSVSCIASFFFQDITRLIQTPLEKKFLKGKYDFKKAIRVFQENFNHSTSIEAVAANLHSDFKNEIEMGPVGLFLPQHYHVNYDITDTFVSYSPEHFTTVFDDAHPLIQFLKESRDVLSQDLELLAFSFNQSKVAAVVPFFDEAALLGFFVLGPKFSEDRLNSEDLEFFRTISQQIPAVLDRIAKTKVAAEVDVAKRIQLDILPEIPPYPGLDVAAFMDAADEVGGDYYDMLVRNDTLWILMGDVTGHGLASGLVMFMAQSILTSVLQTRLGVTPAELNYLANLILCQNMSRLDEERPLTLASFCFSESGRKVILSGSHDNALIYRANTHTVERLVLDDFPMGIGFTDVLGQDDFKEQTLEFQTGDIILMLSDGITEAVKAGNLEGDTLGEAPLEDILLRHNAESANDIRDRVIDAVKTHTQNIFYDDVTLIVVRVVED